MLHRKLDPHRSSESLGNRADCENVAPFRVW